MTVPSFGNPEEQFEDGDYKLSQENLLVNREIGENVVEFGIYKNVNFKFSTFDSKLSNLKFRFPFFPTSISNRRLNIGNQTIHRFGRFFKNLEFRSNWTLFDQTLGSVNGLFEGKVS